MARDRVLNYMTRRLGQPLWAEGVRHPFTLVCFLRTLAVVLHSRSHCLSLSLSCCAVSSIFLILYNTLFIIHFRFVLLLWQRSRQSTLAASQVCYFSCLQLAHHNSLPLTRLSSPLASTPDLSWPNTHQHKHHTPSACAHCATTCSTVP